jgi:RNA polymerase sigma-70 factor (ECF subfamily)
VVEHVAPGPSSDVEIFERLYLANYEPLHSFVRRRISGRGVEPDDVLAEIFLIAWRRLDSIPAPPEDRLWLYGVGRRVVAQADRTLVRRGRLLERLLVRRTEPPSDHADPAVDRVGVALGRLRRSDREVVELFYWDRLHHADIATVLGCSEGAVAQRLHRAKRRLRQRLATTPVPLGAAAAVEPPSHLVPRSPDMARFLP